MEYQQMESLMVLALGAEVSQHYVEYYIADVGSYIADAGYFNYDKI